MIFEGKVEEVRDRTSFKAVDVAYRAKYSMGVTEAGEDGTVWYVVRPKKAHAWLENDFPNTATRWRFCAGGMIGLRAGGITCPPARYKGP